MAAINIFPSFHFDDSVSGLDYQASSQLYGKWTQKRLWGNTGPKQTNSFDRHDKLLPMEKRQLKRWQSSDMLHNLAEPTQEKDNREMPEAANVSEDRGKLLRERLKRRKMMLSKVRKSWRQKGNKAEDSSKIPTIRFQSLLQNGILQVSKSNWTTAGSHDPGHQSKVSSTLNYMSVIKKAHFPQIQCSTDIQSTNDTRKAFAWFKFPPNKDGKLTPMIRGNEYKAFSREKMMKSDISLLNNGKSEKDSTSMVNRWVSELKIHNSVGTSFPISNAGRSGRLHKDSAHWFDSNDVEKMKLLANGSVIAKARIPGHGQVMKVCLSLQSPIAIADLMEYCQQGMCGLIKRPSDLNEIIAFHLDRVLGLNRSLPVLARKFSDDLLPYKFTNGVVRPVVWWDADIQHVDDPNNDQNSFVLSWSRYQAVLRQKCGTNKAHGNHTVPCLGVKHSEWGRLALFDFLLQVHDRLDRHCCGFKPEISEPCVEDLLHEKCSNLKEQLLVHILVRKGNPSQLVYIDNAARLLQANDNLNFRLLEGIDEFPAHAVKFMQSGCLRSRLLKSLRMDREFWDSHNGIKGLKKFVQVIEKRAQILLNYIQEKDIKLVHD
ncbi:Golgi-associated kinase 1A [Rhinoraja longicauda]